MGNQFLFLLRFTKCEVKMPFKSLEEFKTDIDILSLDVENLDDESKVQVVQHLEETSNILKLGSSLDFGNPAPTKRMKLETIEMVNSSSQTDIPGEMLLKEEYIEEKYVPIIDEDYVKKLYNGIIPNCNECEVQFPSIGALDKHSKSHSKSTDVQDEVKVEPVTISDKLPCISCGKLWPSKRSLNDHMISHTDRHRCLTCLHGFSRKSDLKTHSKNPENCTKYLKIPKFESENIKKTSGNIPDLILDTTR